MRLRILLINPWVYDFAAFNLWARPLGLLKAAEYLSAYDTELLLLDCMDSFAPGRYGAGKFREELVEKPAVLRDVPRFYRRYGISIDEFADRLKRLMPVDIVLMTSVMSYWYPGVHKGIELVREAMGDVPIVLGGIYATLHHEHAAESSGADFVYRGGVDDGLKFSLATFGFRLKRKRNPLPYYALGLYERYPFAPLLTSTGCPFRCPYCASGLLAGKYRRRGPDEVLPEIEGLYGLGVRDYAFYDDALLFDAEKHIKPLLREIAGKGLDIRFHTPNGLHARFIDEELACLMKASHFETVRLSLETVNPARQESTGGKIDNRTFETAVRLLQRQGYTKRSLGAYLMYGLPGQGREELRDGIRFLEALGVRIHLAEFSPIRHTSLWDELVSRGTIRDDCDPLVTNNTVYPHLSAECDPEEMKKIKLEVKEYNSRQQGCV